MTVVGLILRIHPDDLAKDPLSDGFGWSESLYGDLLLILLILTLLPIVITLIYRSPAEKALELGKLRSKVSQLREQAAAAGLGSARGKALLYADTLNAREARYAQSQ